MLLPALLSSDPGKLSQGALCLDDPQPLLRPSPSPFLFVRFSTASLFFSLLLSPLNLNYKLTLVHWTWSSKDHQPEWVCVCVTHQTHSWKVSIAAEILDSMLWTWVGWAGHRVSSTKGHRDGPAVCFMHIRILVVCNKDHMLAQHETGQRSALKASLAFSIVNIPKMHASWRDTHMHTQAISAGMYVKHFV